MPTAKQIELKRLFQEAFSQFDNIPSWEKERCINRMANYLATERPVEELKRFKRSPFKAQWRVCTLRMIYMKPPFKDYKPELALSCTRIITKT